MNQEEIWKDVEGYDGLYQVSTHGRVKSFRYGKERIMKMSSSYCVALCKDGEKKQITVRRLVATAFLPNPYNYESVTYKSTKDKVAHIDNIKWYDPNLPLEIWIQRHLKEEKEWNKE